MVLNYNIATLAQILDAAVVGSTTPIVTHVLYDTRKITKPEGGLFFALEGKGRNGHSFITHALENGVRLFVVSAQTTFQFPDACTVLNVTNPLIALQALAHHHRAQFTYPVIAITGSIGKTTFKEWAFHCLAEHFTVVRSPKSFNSQLGVALSLLEMHADANLALIEAGISQPGEMHKLEAMIRPDYGIFTGLGKAHREYFSDTEEQLNEKLLLFKNCKLVFVPENFSTLSDTLPANFQLCKPLTNERFPKGYAGMLGILQSFLHFLQLPQMRIDQTFRTLPTLALRMETFDGINGNTIINDTYNLDKDALLEALHHQQQVAGNKQRIVILGLSREIDQSEEELLRIIEPFHPNAVHFIQENEHIPWEDFSNAVVLVKAHRKRAFEHEVARGKALKHRTFVEINLSSIKHNIQFYRSHLPENVRLLCMVKASSYGSGAVRVAQFLQAQGVAYFGVAFADEGVELRRNGITLPIVVMNPDPEHTDLMVDYQLEPAIYSFEQLDAFTTSLIHRGISHYPVHLKFDTGMHRLGFDATDKERLFAFISAQPEIVIRGIYSHLADADNAEHAAFTLQQITQFEHIVNYFSAHYPERFIAHLLNSEGALRYSDKAFDMVRLGISMYGYTENPRLKNALEPSVKWLSAISQIKTVPAGDSIGYGCSFTATEAMQIAIVPVGYADGFRRSLSNGAGSVVIRGKRCEVVGRVCMDMIMVNVTDLGAQVSDEVEIIGEHQTMDDFARQMGTIPYEVMTGLSKRMQRVYVEN